MNHYRWGFLFSSFLLLSFFICSPGQAEKRPAHLPSGLISIELVPDDEHVRKYHLQVTNHSDKTVVIDRDRLSKINWTWVARHPVTSKPLARGATVNGMRSGMEVKKVLKDKARAHVVKAGETYDHPMDVTSIIRNITGYDGSRSYEVMGRIEGLVLKWDDELADEEWLAQEYRTNPILIGRPPKKH